MDMNESPTPDIHSDPEGYFRRHSDAPFIVVFSARRSEVLAAMQQSQSLFATDITRGLPIPPAALSIDAFRELSKSYGAKLAVAYWFQNGPVDSEFENGFRAYVQGPHPGYERKDLVIVLHRFALRSLAKTRPLKLIQLAPAKGAHPLGITMP